MNSQQSIVEYVNDLADLISNQFDIPVFTERSIDQEDDIYAIVYTDDTKPFEYLNDTDKQLIIYPIVLIRYNLKTDFYESQAVDYAKDVIGILTENANRLNFQSIESGFDVDSDGNPVIDKFITLLKFRSS